MRQLLSRHPRAFGLIAVTMLSIASGIATPFVLNPSGPALAVSPGSSGNSVQADQPVTGTLQKGTPEYDTVLPEGKKISDYGGWTRVSPPNRDPVFAYADKIGAIPINVSQQPLPKEFADQPDQQIQLFAQGYAADTKLTVTGAIAYVGTSAKGPQSVIVVKDKLLILIKASAAIQNQEWEKYIQSLG